MLKTQIEDTMTGNIAKVSKYGAVGIYNEIPELPPVHSKNRHTILRGLLGSTGLSTGTTNQNVNGSSTPQIFFVQAEQDVDLWITTVSVLIADTTMNLKDFGGVSQLTNGWSLKIEQSGRTDIIIQNAKTNGEVIVKSGNLVPYTILANYLTNDNALLVSIPLTNFLIPEGLRIGRGSRDRIISEINDDLTGLTLFEVRIFGFRRLP